MHTLDLRTIGRKTFQVLLAGAAFMAIAYRWTLVKKYQTVIDRPAHETARPDSHKNSDVHRNISSFAL